MGPKQLAKQTLSVSDDAQSAKEFIAKGKEYHSLGLETHCMCCGEAIDFSGQEPYFLANGLDRVYSSQDYSHHGGFDYYSFAFMRGGMSSFPICFTCFSTGFPVFFDRLTKKLEETIVGPEPVDEIALTAELISEIMAKGNPEAIRRIGHQLDRMGEHLFIDWDIEPK
jgi:hypothetical protein